MRVLMVNKFVYPRAGAETYMLYVAECLRRDGHEVALFGMEHPANTDTGFVTYTVPNVEFGEGLTGAARAGQVVKALELSAFGVDRRALRHCLEAFQPDLVHAHNVYNQLSPGLFRGVTGAVPVLMTAHDYKAVCPNYSLFTHDRVCRRCLHGTYLNCLRYRCCHGRLLPSLLEAASAMWHAARHTYTHDYQHFIAPSAFMRDQLVEGGIPADLVTVVNNFAQLPEHATPPGTGLLYAGRLCREKGIDLVIDALSRLGPDAPPLTVAGEGPLEAELKAQADAAGLKEVRWLGRIGPPQVIEELARCAVSVVPSRWYENCSMSIMESLAHGRPCVVSDSGGNPELVEHGESGWVFRRDDVDSLDAVLRALPGDAEALAACGRAARAAAVQRFSPEVHMEQLYAVYRRLGAGAAGDPGR